MMRSFQKVYNLLIFSIFTMGFAFCSACAQSVSNSIPVNAESETVLLNNQSGIVPILRVDVPIFYINIGYVDSVLFLNTLQRYTAVQPIALNELNSLVSGNYLIVTLSDAALINQASYIQLFNDLMAKDVKVIAVVVQQKGNLSQFELVQFPIVWHTNSASKQGYASYLAQALMGGKTIQGTLSQSYGTTFTQGKGFKTQKIRLGYSDLAYQGYDSDALDELGVIAEQAIQQKAAPGMNVMVIKNAEVVYERSFGNYTYASNSEVQNPLHLFDLASVTKIMATTPEVMYLVQEGKIYLSDKISQYLPEFKGKPAEHVSIQEVMLHEAGFIPFIPFYRFLSKTDYAADSSAAYCTKVAVNYYLRKDYFQQVMWPAMVNATIKTRGNYVYSDISMYVMRAIIQKVTGKDLPEVLAQNFYIPLGLQNTGFNPWKNHPINSITPTEEDTYFRRQVLQAYVHDQGAAMAGGISGHAGLFSTANDMAIFYQMLLNGGTYGGVTYLDSKIVKQFTQQFHTSSRRGLGFDKRDLASGNAYPSKFASAALYGHTGYTGTCVWVDPNDGFIFIFLSNRVQPKVSPQLIKLKIRERMLDVVYQKLASTLNK